MPTRENPLEVWATTATAYRAQRTYIDEMTDQLQARLNEEVTRRIYEEFTQATVPEPILRTETATERRDNLDAMFFNWFESEIIEGAKAVAEPEDVDPKEFEKILNGG